MIETSTVIGEKVCVILYSSVGREMLVDIIARHRSGTSDHQKNSCRELRKVNRCHHVVGLGRCEGETQGACLPLSHALLLARGVL